MAIVYECYKCLKLYRSSIDAIKCCGCNTRSTIIESHEIDRLASIIESSSDSISSDSSNDSSSDFSSGGGDFGGGGASGDW